MTTLPWKLPNETAEIVFLTPEEARDLLKLNSRNRPLSRAYVARLKADMRAGRWVYNGEAIKFSTDLRLLDGQHRLTALSEMPEGTVIKFLVVYGLDDIAQDTMDQTRTRWAKDQIVLDGLVDAGEGKNVAAAARAWIIWQDGMLFSERRDQLTNPAIIEWIRTHPSEVEIMRAVNSVSGLTKVPARPGLLIALLTKFHMIDSESAHQFTHGLVTGANLPAHHPVLTLRNRLIQSREAKKRVSDREMIALFVYAWNAFRQGRTMVKIVLPKGLITADNLPTPK